MKVIVENKLDKISEIYKAFSNISAEKFEEFYSKIVSNDVLDDVINLKVEIKDESMFDEPEIYCSFTPELKESKQDNFSLGKPLRRTKSRRCFDLYDLIASDYSAYTFDLDKGKITTLWRQFLTENLGENFYRPLLAKHLKNSINIEISEKNREYQGLVAKLAQIESEKASLQEINEKIDQEYADVLNKSKTAKTSEETAKQTKNPVETTETKQED